MMMRGSQVAPQQKHSMYSSTTPPGNTGTENIVSQLRTLWLEYARSVCSLGQRNSPLETVRVTGCRPTIRVSQGARICVVRFCVMPLHRHVLTATILWGLVRETHSWRVD